MGMLLKLLESLALGSLLLICYQESSKFQEFIKMHLSLKNITDFLSLLIDLQKKKISSFKSIKMHMQDLNHSMMKRYARL
jgi:hypothetical protein